MKDKKIIFIFSALLILLLRPAVFAQNSTNATNSTNSTTTLMLPTANEVYSFLLTVNPLLYLIAGFILIIASKLAKWVGIALIIIALIHVLLLIFV